MITEVNNRLTDMMIIPEGDKKAPIRKFNHLPKLI
jgi:hypothetical protein